MSTVWKYALGGAVIGLIPFSSLFLILLEVVMVYHLSVIHKRPFSLGELGVIWGILLVFSGILHVVVGTIFDFMGPFGWFAKAILALVFILCFGGLVNWYYDMENKKQSARQ